MQSRQKGNEDICRWNSCCMVTVMNNHALAKCHRWYNRPVKTKNVMTSSIEMRGHKHKHGPCQVLRFDDNGDDDKNVGDGMTTTTICSWGRICFRMPCVYQYYSDISICLSFDMDRKKSPQDGRLYNYSSNSCCMGSPSRSCFLMPCVYQYYSDTSICLSFDIDRKRRPSGRASIQLQSKRLLHGQSH